MESCVNGAENSKKGEKMCMTKGVKVASLRLRNSVQRVQQGGGSLMFWGGIMWGSTYATGGHGMRRNGFTIHE